MPIQKHNRNLYPRNWEVIKYQIKVERANLHCEFCNSIHGAPHPVTGKLVYLAVAHLDQDPTNNDFKNLAALCQRCHLNHDRAANQLKRLIKNV